ncbi:DUF871 domain-containing protein [Aerococcaceae bacterium DSM 111021]|nr:DUF871 domain-containing protein [Aerococcaceae bacterium DSM 111021]
MRKLGISIYPEKDDSQRIKEYIKKASESGFSRIFSCLLSADGDKNEIVAEFIDVNSYAKELGFEVIVDVAPRIFEKLEISYADLSFFKEIGADGLRLDMGFTGSEEALMTYNEHDLLIEINMSNNVHTIDTIMDYQPNQYNLIACHNFYPHRYSALGIEFFKACTERFTQHGLRTAAFITSQNENTYGPWPVTDGLPTLEIHRELPLDVQLKHYITLNLVDDIIISNCFPTVEELNNVSKLDLKMPTFNVDPIEGLPETETAILFNTLHFNRGDVSENMIRSTQSRVKYKGHQFDVFNTPEVIRRGDVVIESSEYGHYAGELQIALKDMKNSGKSNVVGKVREEEVFILDDIKPWQKFKLQANR